MLEVIQQEGFEKGFAQGMAEGLLEGQAKILISVLKARFGEIPTTLCKKLMNAKDIEYLKALLKPVATCQSLKEFQEAL